MTIPGLGVLASLTEGLMGSSATERGGREEAGRETDGRFEVRVTPALRRIERGEAMQGPWIESREVERVLQLLGENHSTHAETLFHSLSGLAKRARQGRQTMTPKTTHVKPAPQRPKREQHDSQQPNAGCPRKDAPKPR